MKMITVKLQGVEVQAALLSPDVMKRVEDGFDKAIKTIETEGEKENVSGSASVRKQCQAVIDYVTDIFGADAARKIFGGETDYLTCLDVLEEIQCMYPEQVSPIIRQKNEALQTRMKKSEE